MKNLIFRTATVFVATFSIALAQSGQATCGAGSTCPESAPCCSQYGQCGVGAYCLGGCDPALSFSLDSCVAAPVCQSTNYQLNSLNDIQPNTEYLGDATQANWVSSGTPLVYNDDSVLLTMAQGTVGTLLMSTHYVWYGKISATMTTSQGQGVVTAFIMMSDMKDEIDFEFVGTDINSAQSNFYWQGVTDYNNELNLSVSNTVASTHIYTFDWTPDYITWSIDGNVMRTLNKNDTWNSTDNQFHFPQTPARIELSLWPAGLSTNGEGTIDWAGGLISWDSPYMQKGYYYAQVKSVDVECYQPPSGFSNNFGSNAYYYDNAIGTNNTVCIGNNNTVLSSFLATGDNPSYNPNAKPSGTQTGSAPQNTASVESVPGLSGTGTYPGSSSGDGSSSGSSGSPGSSGSSGGQSGPASVNAGGFVQDTTGTSQAPRVVASSAVALLGFFFAAAML